MASTTITEQWIENVGMGGTVLSGGGGGVNELSRSIAKMGVEYGSPHLVSPSTLPSDGKIITVSAIGSAGGEHVDLQGRDFVRAVELLREEVETRGDEIVGLMVSEMGAFQSTNGILQSAVLDLPLVDAAADGRGHPTGTMGMMGLPDDEYYLRAAAGGAREANRYVELLVDADFFVGKELIRDAAVKAGGLIAVARNPISVEYVVENGVTDIYGEAEAIGSRVRSADNGEASADSVVDYLKGDVVVSDTVAELTFETKGGFDVGSVSIGEYEMTFWNEYMTIEKDGKRLATFPDLIVTFDLESGSPAPIADLEEGAEVTVATVPREYLKLGASLQDRELFRPAEEATGKSIIEYVF